MQINCVRYAHGVRRKWGGETYGTTVGAVDVTQQSLDVALDLVRQGKVLPVLKVEEEESKKLVRILTRLRYATSTHS